MLDQLGKSRYYTTLDLAQDYHQVKMHQDHKERTEFSTERGHFEFKRVSFGLKGAPAPFQTDEYSFNRIKWIKNICISRRYYRYHNICSRYPRPFKKTSRSFSKINSV